MRLDDIILQSVQQWKCGVLFDGVQDMTQATVGQLDKGMIRILKCLLLFSLVLPG